MSADSAMYDVDNLAWEQVLDAILEECRLEFYQEELRAFDIY